MNVLIWRKIKPELVGRSVDLAAVTQQRARQRQANSRNGCAILRRRSGRRNSTRHLQNRFTDIGAADPADFQPCLMSKNDVGNAFARRGCVTKMPGIDLMGSL